MCKQLRFCEQYLSRAVSWIEWVKWWENSPFILRFTHSRWQLEQIFSDFTATKRRAEANHKSNFFKCMLACEQLVAPNYDTNTKSERQDHTAWRNIWHPMSFRDVGYRSSALSVRAKEKREQGSTRNPPRAKTRWQISTAKRCENKSFKKLSPIFTPCHPSWKWDCI